MAVVNPKIARLTALDPIWAGIREEAEAMAATEPMLAGVAHAVVLRHDSLEAALSYRMAQKLGDADLPAIELREIAEEALAAAPEIGRAARADIAAVRERDPACHRFIEPLLFFKGFQALTAQRVAHWLWEQGRKDAAGYIQMRMSELFSVDIHPAARIGRGIMIDHAHAIVIGETAVVGDDVSLLHGVTLGGTGKEEGDRHPKIGDGVLIGAGAKILGNIRVGACSRVAAGSVVLKDVPENVTVAGVPAKVVGDAGCAKPSCSMQHGFALEGEDAQDIVPDC